MKNHNHHAGAIRGSVYGTIVIAGKPQKRNNKVRHCKECGVKLNSYNLSKFCYLHREIYYPRVRAKYKQKID